MSTYTRGPWHVDSIDQVRTKDGLVIARCERKARHEYMDGKEQSANARLIAASPDLYEALKQADNIIRNILTDTQLDTRTACGATIREYYKRVTQALAQVERRD